MFKLKMLFTKLIHGEYSFQYVDLFRKKGFRSPFLRCISDEFYSHILILLKKDPKVKVFDTSGTIQFGNTSFSLTSGELFKLKGIPFCFNALVFDDYSITIIGYNEMIQNAKLKSIYIFANDVFILGEYLFTETLKTHLNNISDTLIKKYISDSTENIDKFFIKDRNQNHIFFSDNGFEISIKYFLVNSPKSKEIYSDFTKKFSKTDDNIDAIRLKLAEIF